MENAQIAVEGSDNIFSKIDIIRKKLENVNLYTTDGQKTLHNEMAKHGIEMTTRGIPSDQIADQITSKHCVQFHTSKNRHVYIESIVTGTIAQTKGTMAELHSAMLNAAIHSIFGNTKEQTI